MPIPLRPARTTRTTGPTWSHDLPPIVLSCAILLLLFPGVLLAANHTVEARANYTFFPSSLTIQVGDTVTWVNEGGSHNVSANDDSFRCANGCDGDGGDGNPSTNAWSFTLTFDDPGTITYICEVHASLGMTGTITVEEGTTSSPGELRFAQASQSRSEGAGAFNVQVNRVGGDDGAVSVSYSTSDGSAQAGADYTPATGTLSWPDGNDDTRTFQVPILDDAEEESNETVNVALSNPTGGAALTSPSNATLTIRDDDESTAQPGELGFVSSEFAADETQGTHAIAVQRMGASDGAVSVDYATSDGSAFDGLDYTGTSGTLQWADGEAGIRSFEVTILDDSEEENTESVNLTLSDPTGGATLGTSSATLEISDDDATGGGCIENDTSLCLRADDRFQVTVNWRTRENETGPGRVIPFGPADSGLFWFFDADNAEILVKALNGCQINDHFWVFIAATTDVEFTLTVTDTETGESKDYFNALGDPAPAVTDTSAFATCP